MLNHHSRRGEGLHGCGLGHEKGQKACHRRRSATLVIDRGWAWNFRAGGGPEIPWGAFSFICRIAFEPFADYPCAYRRSGNMDSHSDSPAAVVRGRTSAHSIPAIVCIQLFAGRLYGQVAPPGKDGAALLPRPSRPTEQAGLAFRFETRRRREIRQFRFP